MLPLGYLYFSGHLTLQWCLTALLAVLCITFRKRGTSGALQEDFVRVSSCSWRVFVGVLAVAFVVVASLALKRGLPLPYVHDEFSYLLAADTYAHGRLANPTPACWPHFESFHILVHPTYASKYPPAQGLIMALGQVLVGHPIWGIWLSTALAAAVTAWMLAAFLPRPYPLLGGILMAVHPQVLEWGQRYWGGCIALLGGALLLGAIARLLRLPEPRKRDAAWMAVALLILANSRPFEGLLLSAILGLAVLPRFCRFPHRFLPAMLILLLGGAWMAYFNWRVTGNPLRMAYQEHHAQYAVVPLFLHQPKAPQPKYLHLQMFQFHVNEQGYWYNRRESWYKIWEEIQKNIVRLHEGSFGNVSILYLPLLILPLAVWKDRRLWYLSLAMLLFLLGLLIETYMYPHYGAPAGGLVLAIVLLTLYHLARSGPWGQTLVRLTVSVFFLWAAFWWIGFFSWQQNGWFARRQWMIDDFFNPRPGKHLVFVRYQNHNVHEEWVYNGAELDRQKVLWVREMDQAQNRKLIETYGDRQAWLVEPEPDPLKAVPTPYQPETAPAMDLWFNKDK